MDFETEAMIDIYDYDNDLNPLIEQELKDIGFIDIANEWSNIFKQEINENNIIFLRPK